ncbi:uncharacterized protein [Magallana gigas]|uniref:uncharacterized protein isoform X4 n=1 Tax=Magallana gigas TaxID=29159 RepID=UPI0033417F3F
MREEKWEILMTLLDSESTFFSPKKLSTQHQPMTAPEVSSSAPLNNHPFYMQTDNRPSTSAETGYEAYDRRPIKPQNTDVFKGIKHNFQVSPPTQSGNVPALGTKKKTPPTAQAHDYDTSQEVSQFEQIVSFPSKGNIAMEEISYIQDMSLECKSLGRRSASQRSDHKSARSKKDSNRVDRSSIPVTCGKNCATVSRTHSDYTPGRYAPRKHLEQFKLRRTDSKSKGKKDSRVFPKPTSDATLNADHRAATVIQATWRGYWARECNAEVVSVRKEIRARRAEDHIVMLRAELDRQRKLYDEERHMRTLQMEAIRCLWKEVQSLQNWKSEVLNSQQFRNTMDSNHQDDSYNYSQEIQTTLERMGNYPGDSGRMASFYSMDEERQRELERTCASLQTQVAQLSQALQSVSSVVFQSGIMTSGMDSIHSDSNQTLLVTGYDEDGSSSCEEISYTGSKWATVPHSLSPYPSEEEEQYFHSFPQLGCPTPPRNLHMEHKGENSIVLSWGPSKILDTTCKEINKPFIGYRVYVDDKPAAMINGLAALVHGLNPQITYKYFCRIYVKAVSSLGESNSSDILMTAMSQIAHNCTSSSESNRTDSDHDSTESSDMARKRKDNHQRQKRRIKSPRQDKRQLSRKGSSTSDQERHFFRSEKSKPSNNAYNVFKHPKIHTRPNSGSCKLPDSESQYSECVEGLPQPSESKQSPQAGSQNKGSSTSQMSETFTVDSSESLLMAISRAQSNPGVQDPCEQDEKSHRRKRSKDLKLSEVVDEDMNQNQASPSSGSVNSYSFNIAEENIKLHGNYINRTDDLPREKTQPLKKTKNKEYEWRRDIEMSSHMKDQEKKDVKKAWVKESPTAGEVHGIPIIDASKRHSSGSRPSSPAPTDASEKSEKKRSVAELLEKFSSKTSSNFGTSSLGTEGSEQHQSQPLKSRRTCSNEDVSIMPENRRTPTKNMSPSSGERRRTPSNGSESDVSEISNFSAARQLDMDKKPILGTTGINKLLQKLQNFSKSQEESLQNRAQKMKKKCEKSENSGIEEEQRRLRRISGGSDGDSVMERTVHQSDSSSQSDDPQLNKKPYKTHKRSGSDQRVTFLQQRQSSAPSTPSHHSANSSPGSHFDDYTSRPKTNVKRTASFHGETPSAKKEVQPRRSGSDDMLMAGMLNQNQDNQAGVNLHHIPILSGAQLQTRQKPP